MNEHISFPRVFLRDTFQDEKKITLQGYKSHHLLNVIRVKVNDKLVIFNGIDGEWLSFISKVSRSVIEISLLHRLRPQNKLAPLVLLFSPVKKNLTNLIIQKATELGVTEIWPIVTERTNLSEINLDRLYITSVGAAEQSRRLSLPLIKEPVDLLCSLEDWVSEIPMYVADKSFQSNSISKFFLTKENVGNQGVGFLIGPEGGFSDSELEKLLSHSFVKKIFLGPRILRTETASIAVLSIWQAACEDW
jgi:16S rRNA (uracil1498-N3)-methyltransferase